MANKTTAQIVEKYQRGVSGASNDYAAGVQNPSRPWAAATVAGQKRWANGIQRAIQNGSFAKGVQAAGDQKWQQNAVTYGTSNYAAAAAKAADAYQAVADRVMGAAKAAQNAVANMPTETFEQRIARSAAAQRAISAQWNGGTPRS